MADVENDLGIHWCLLNIRLQEPIPVWIGDYVLAGYGTGAVWRYLVVTSVIMLLLISLKDKVVACHQNIDKDISEAAFWFKDGFKLVDSDFLNGLGYKEGTYK
jgi:leucyl-tRNA synthetase